MAFIETSIVTEQVGDLRGDDECALLQEDLANDPPAGNVIQGTGTCANHHGPRWEKENAAACA